MSEAAETVPTAAQQLKPYQFKPGQSGNPKGRPKGSRNEFGEDFIRAVHEDFQEHGIDAIRNVRKDDPAGWFRVCASILPKELKITHTADFDSLTDEQLRARLADFLANFAALGIVIDGQGVVADAGGRGQGEAAPLQPVPETT